MFVEIDGINVYYEHNNGVGEPILLLHGWGASSSAMMGIFKFLASSNKMVFALDFPGFGKSGEPTSNYGVQEYAALVQDFMFRLNISKPIVLGHSFGGRIGIILASNNMVSKLILVDSAGLKPKFSLKKAMQIYAYKLRKKLNRNVKSMGSKDYLALDGNMKSVFVRVVNSYLDKSLKKIKAPTLLVWGQDDFETPLYMAKKMNKKIADSGLVVLNNCGHFCFADNYVGFCKIIDAFI